jgi:hypothetical protein
MRFCYSQESDVRAVYSCLGRGRLSLEPFPGRSLNQRSDLFYIAIHFHTARIFMTEKLATLAWFVRVKTSEAEPALIDFVVGKASLQDAVAAILHHPELDFGDEVTSTSQLSMTEINSYRLRPDEIRSYGRRVYSSGRWIVERAR